MSAPLTSGQILDGYHLVRFIGRGGFGEVWLCRSAAMGDYRALKFIQSTHADRFDKEYGALLHYRKSASRLRSAHIVPIEHANRSAAGLFYVMPLADGTADNDPADPAWQPLSLAAHVQEQTGQPAWFTSREIISLIQPILEALQTLSEAGLVHRDVKPENILVFNGQPCLGDISLLGADAAMITRRGTPGYSTPSWYEGGHPDMYGVAATLYTLLTGNSPDKMGRSSFLWPPQGEASLDRAERLEWKRIHDVIRRATQEKVSERFMDFRTMAASANAETPQALASYPQQLTPPTADNGMLLNNVMTAEIGGLGRLAYIGINAAVLTVAIILANTFTKYESIEKEMAGYFTSVPPIVFILTTIYRQKNIRNKPWWVPLTLLPPAILYFAYLCVLCPAGYFERKSRL